MENLVGQLWVLRDMFCVRASVNLTKPIATFPAMPGEATGPYNPWSTGGDGVCVCGGASRKASTTLPTTQASTTMICCQVLLDAVVNVAESLSGPGKE